MLYFQSKCIHKLNQMHFVQILVSLFVLLFLMFHFIYFNGFLQLEEKNFAVFPVLVESLRRESFIR